ncbi:MAG: LamG domain-containing protein [Phycisphaerae bacterium]|nr:LamG domain-containing protein [Phycisphaerae bacterium]
MRQGEFSILWFLLAVAAVCPVFAADKKKPAALDEDPALVGWWKFEEKTGTTAADSSAAKHHGTLAGQVTFEVASVEGKVGNGLMLAADQYVEIKNYKGITGTKPRSVAAWFKTTKRQGDIAVWGARDSGKQFRFGHIRGRLGMTPFGGYYYMKEYTDNGKWHHIVLVITESELPNLHDNVSIFLDGKIAEVDDIGLLDLLPIETAEGADVRLGSGFEGILDDVRIYSRSLTLDEAKTIYEGKSNKPIEK